MNHDSIDDDQFLMISRSIPQEELSFEAKGVLLYLFSKPSDWQIRFQDLQRFPNAGYTKLKRIFKELHKAGYVYRPYSEKDLETNGRPWKFSKSPFAYEENAASGTVPRVVPPQNARVRKPHPLEVKNNNNKKNLDRAKTPTITATRGFNVNDNSPTLKLVRAHADFSVKHYGADPRSLGNRTIQRWESVLRKRLSGHYSFKEVKKIHQWWMAHYNERDEYKYMPRKRMKTIHGFCDRFADLRESYLEYQQEDNESEGKGPILIITGHRKFKPSKEVE